MVLLLTSTPPDSRPRAAPRYGAGGRIVGARAHHSSAYTAWKAAAAAEARACWDGRPALDGPVQVHICAVLSPPKAARPMGGAPRRWAPRKPDVDNVAKGVLDALTDAGVWMDDAQVVALSVHRCWGAVDARARGAEAVVEPEHIEVYVMAADGEPGRW
jgi:Holliday junction resolvase RusA-like endonuclease